MTAWRRMLAKIWHAVRPYSVYLLNRGRRECQLGMHLSQNSVRGVGGMVHFTSNERNL